MNAIHHDIGVFDRMLHRGPFRRVTNHGFEMWRLHNVSPGHCHDVMALRQKAFDDLCADIARRA
jgi:hypothetical protein